MRHISLTLKVKKKISFFLFVVFLGVLVSSPFLQPAAEEAYTQDNLKHTGEIEGEAWAPEEFIRLHVVASENAAEDQALKLRVVDRVLVALTPLLLKTKSKKEAEEVIQARLALLEREAKKETAAKRESYPVRVEWGYFSFPEKTYGDLTLAAGEYEAVRLVLGEGKGSNWWCVLFPPLCFVDISRAVSQEPQAAEVLATGTREGKDAKDLAEGEVVLRSKLLELWQDSWRYLAAKFEKTPNSGF